MNKLIVLAMLVLGTIGLQAQDDTRAMGADSVTVHGSNAETASSETTSSDKYNLGVGVSIGGFGGGISIENAEGRKVNPAFWALPSYGAVIYAPFGKGAEMGGRLDIGVSSTGTKTRPYENYDGKGNWQGFFNEKYTYFTIAPQVSLMGVILGVGINFPMSGERWNPNSSAARYYVDKEILTSPKLDVRLGGMITVWKTTHGRLFVDLQAKYDLGGGFKDDMYIYGTPVTSLGNPVPAQQADPTINLTTASCSIGIGYIFNVGF